MNPMRDSNGVILQGFEKDSRGVITIKNDAELKKYLFARNQALTIKKLTEDVEELKMLVNDLINKQKE